MLTANDEQIRNNPVWWHEQGLMALDVAKRMENKRKKEGWRYVTLNRFHKVFVPCDKEGNPTKEGKERIERAKQILRIL